MYYLLNNKGKLFYFLIAILLCSACHQKQGQEKFKAPVEEVIKLDSTKIGISTIISGLNVPWEIAWGPDGQIWFTEQSGTVSKVDPHTGKEMILLQVPGVTRARTLGLLGMAVSLDKSKPYVFIDYTHIEDSAKNGTPAWGVSRLVRYTYTEDMDTLMNPQILLEVPSAGPRNGHNGSRIAISPEGKVFWSTGDSHLYKNAQDTSSLNGKILRLNMDGSIPDDNPFPGSPVWSLGHRNPQGLVFTSNGMLFESEHGPADDDELNIIVKGENYGWPEVKGFCDLADEKKICDSMHVIQPIKAWTPTIAPCGIDYYHSNKIPEWNNVILLATLKTQSFRALKLNDKKDAVTSEKIYFEDYFGRLRDVCISPGGDVYIATSNQDWNPSGKPRPYDDRIIRIAKISDLDNLSQVDVNNPVPASALSSSQKESSKGKSIYLSYCSSCHKPEGNGLSGTFPSLNNNRVVTGNKDRLITIVLKGDAAISDSEKSKWGGEGGMPAFNFLDNNKIAEILTYIRSSWSNHADSISADEVKAIRRKLK